MNYYELINKLGIKNSFKPIKNYDFKGDKPLLYKAGKDIIDGNNNILNEFFRLVEVEIEKFNLLDKTKYLFINIPFDLDHRLFINDDINNKLQLLKIVVIFSLIRETKINNTIGAGFDFLLEQFSSGRKIIVFLNLPSYDFIFKSLPTDILDQSVFTEISCDKFSEFISVDNIHNKESCLIENDIPVNKSKFLKVLDDIREIKAILKGDYKSYVLPILALNQVNYNKYKFNCSCNGKSFLCSLKTFCLIIASLEFSGYLKTSYSRSIQSTSLEKLTYPDNIFHFLKNYKVELNYE